MNGTPIAQFCHYRNLLYLFLFLSAVLAPLLLQAQGLDDVHVTPRPEEKKVERSIDPSLDVHGETIKKDVDLVLVPVNVITTVDTTANGHTVAAGAPITGLEKGDFEIYEGKEKQEIKHFSTEDAPVIVGIIMDTSGSVDTKLELEQKALVHFCQISNPADKFFMLSFSNEGNHSKPEVRIPLTQKCEELQNAGAFFVSKGMTPLLDAVHIAVQMLQKEGRTDVPDVEHPRLALLIISDGGDNASRHTEKEVGKYLQEAGVMVYSIGVFDRMLEGTCGAGMTAEPRASSLPTELCHGPDLLRTLSEKAGGVAFSVTDPADIIKDADQIGLELRNMYVLGYRPKNPTNDGKYRKVKVKLHPPKGLPPMRVFAKAGYYSPEK